MARGLGPGVSCWVQTRLQVRAALLTKSIYGARQAMGVHLFRGESTGPRIGGPGVHQSGGSTGSPTSDEPPAATGEGPLLHSLVIVAVRGSTRMTTPFLIAQLLNSQLKHAST